MNNIIVANFLKAVRILISKSVIILKIFQNYSLIFQQNKNRNQFKDHYGIISLCGIIFINTL